jgi:2-keto-4-pentenoate hydratase/2-oxohepta-3-ene-1,7-dioic acid hydratase in catechol pathway
MTNEHHTSGQDSTNGSSDGSSLTNYIAYQFNGSERKYIGHYDAEGKTIQPLAFASGTLLENLYQVIQVGEAGIIPSGDKISTSDVKILPPLSGRDVLCVGKNYAEHAKEFNSSGFDSSDKVDQPTHPVIFTKRFTSIIGAGQDIYAHPSFTETIDYEGEIGVIIGKAGHQISEENAMEHVWGFTIVNDMTARERQRDHKQFYIGKSPDTFCPMVYTQSSSLHMIRLLTSRTGSDCRTSRQAQQSAKGPDQSEWRIEAGRHNGCLDLQHPVPYQNNVRGPDAHARRYSGYRNCKSP